MENTIDIELLSSYFRNGDVRTAMDYMKHFPELEKMREQLADIFERENYIVYDIPDNLNSILRLYQQYFRDVFYLRLDEEVAKESLFENLSNELGIKRNMEKLERTLSKVFEKNGFHILTGKTNGHYGPYVWKETVPTSYTVELVDSTQVYTINILKGFVMCSWLNYLTFDEFGTSGWASPNGIINFIENRYDLENERFKVSLLKHEAQHCQDMARWPKIKPGELEYRAKLVEMIYSKENNLLKKFVSEADQGRPDDGHAVAAVRIEKEMSSIINSSISDIQKLAHKLFDESTIEKAHKYEKSAKSA